jgi:hypothetical protein
MFGKNLSNYILKKLGKKRSPVWSSNYFGDEISPICQKKNILE